MASPRQDARTEQADEVVGLFRSADAVEAAISALTSAGWDRSELSLLAQKSAFDANPPMGDAERAADDPNTQRAPVVSGTDVPQRPTLAPSLPALIAALIGAAAAGGGAAAAVEALGQWAGHSRDDFLHEQVKRGGILLFVMLRRPDQEQIARDILVKHGAEEVRVHHARQAEPATGH